MRTKFYIAPIFGLLLLISGCIKTEKSYCHSECARCGRHRHMETKSGVTVQDKISPNEVSVWLSAYRSGACKHVWIPVSGGSSKGIIWPKGPHWDGVSHWHTCLYHMKQLEPTVGEPETRQLLKRYYAILEMAHGPEEEEKPIALSTDPKVGEKLKELAEELKSKLDQIDNERMPAH